MRRAEQLQASVTRIIDQADYDGAIAANVAATQAFHASAFGGSGHKLETVKALEGVVVAVLPRLFAAYNAERAAFLIDRHELDRYVVAGIRKFYADALRHGPDQKAMWGVDNEVFENALAEAQGRTLALAEEHFIHPGLQAWHQRHSLLVASFSTVLGAVIGALAKAGVDKLA